MYYILQEEVGFMKGCQSLSSIHVNVVIVVVVAEIRNVIS